MATYEMGDVYEVVMKADDSDMARATSSAVSATKKLDDQWKAAMSSWGKAMDTAAAKTRDAQAPAEEMNSSISQLGAGASRMIATFLSVRAAIGVFQEFASVLKEMRDYAMKTAEETEGFQKALLAIKAMKGGGIVDEGFMREHMDFIKETGMEIPKAQAYRKQWVAETGRLMAPGQEKMDPKEYANLEKMAAEYAMAKGMDPATIAQVTGRIMAQGKKGETASDVFGQMVNLVEAINAGGGDTSAVMRQVLPVMGGMVDESGRGLIGSRRALGILSQGAAAVNPDETGQTLQQFARAITGHTGSKQWNKYVEEKIGVKPGTQTEDAMNQVFDWMKQQDEAGVDLYKALQDAGLNRFESQKALVGMYTKSADYMRGLFKKTPVDAVPGAMADIRQYYDPRTLGGGAEERAARIKELGPIIAGQRNREMKQYMDEAEGKLKAADQFGAPAALARGPLGGVASFFARQVGYDLNATIDDMNKQALARQLAERPVEEGGLAVRVHRGAWEQGHAEMQRRMDLMPGLGGAMARGMFARPMEFLGGLERFSRAQSGELATDLEAARTAGIDPNSRLISGPDSQMHTMAENREIMRRMGYSTEQIRVASQKMEESLRRSAARPLGGPKPPGRERP